MAHRAVVFRVVGCCWLGLVLHGGVVAAAQGEPAGQTLNLHGTVVNGVTGQPLARALVTSMDRRLATMTDEDGHFALPVHLTAAASAQLGGGVSDSSITVVLLGRKPGYILARGGARQVNLDSTTDSTAVEIKLMPSGAVSGSVTADQVAAANGVRVSLLRHAVQNGAYRWQLVNSQTIGARGQFRFAELAPGEYTVVTATWRGPERSLSKAERMQGYPSTFAGGTSTLTPASVLRVRYGETAVTELHLRCVPFFQVTVPVAASEERNLSARLMGDMSLSSLSLSYKESDGAIEGQLPDGDYRVLVTGVPAQAPMPSPQAGPIQGPLQQDAALLQFQVAGAPVRLAPVTLVSMPPVRVRVQAADGGELPTQGFLAVTLIGLGAEVGGYSGVLRPGSGGTFLIQNVVPGRYRVVVNTRQSVASLRCGGTDLLIEPLVVGASGVPQDVEVTLGTAGGSVTGSVSAPGGQASGRAYLTLLPVSSEARFAEGGTGPDGRFVLMNIAPGDYRIFASGSPAQDVPYREPAAMRAMHSLGVAVTVADGQSTQVTVPWVEPAEVEQLEAEAEGSAQDVP